MERPLATDQYCLGRSQQRFPFLQRKLLMDNGIWATWYDIDDSDRQDFLNWSHDVYLPYLRNMPGHAWVAHYENVGGGAAMAEVGRMVDRPDPNDVPTGKQFLILVGAASPHVFFTPEWAEKRLPSTLKERLQQRRNAARCVFTEVARVTGPSASKRPEGTVTTPAIQMGSFRYKTPEAEFALAEWYANYRLPHMAAMPGVIATRKLVSVAGWPKHGILYEFESLEHRLKHFEQPHEALALDPAEWTGKIVRDTIHLPGSPVIGRRLWPTVD